MKVYLFVIALFILAPFGANDVIASNVITIPLNKWSSQRVLSTAIGQTIIRAGIPVEFVNISADDQWGALRRGNIHFQLEVWEPSMKQPFNSLVTKGKILDAGTHQARVTEDWWYPKYVEEVCPDLPDWRALNKCKNLFTVSNPNSKGIYYGGPWNYGDADIIRALNIDFTIERLSDGKALWRQLAKSKRSSTPIILLNWSPNWTDKYIDGQFVEFPAYEPQCEANPEWGLNKHLTKDCGNRRNGWLKKVAAKRLKTDFPCVYFYLKNINFTNQMLVDASALLVVDKLSEEDAAKQWRKRYHRELSHWTNNTCLAANTES